MDFEVEIKENNEIEIEVDIQSNEIEIDISNIVKEINPELTEELKNRIEELETQKKELETEITSLETENTSLKRELEPYDDFVESEIGNPINLNDSTDLSCEIILYGNAVLDGTPSPDTPVEIITVGKSGSVEITIDNALEETDENYQVQKVTLPIQQEFVKTTNYSDEFIKQNGIWYEKHNFGKKTLNGTETYTQSSVKKSVFVLNDATVMKVNYNSYVSRDLISNMFCVGASHDILTSNNQYNNYMAINKNPGFSFRNDNFTVISNFKSWLSTQNANGTPVTIYYPLATPILKQCTTEQSNILNSFATYRNKTNISVDGIGTLKVFYKKER
jgi:hypothetical protein